MEITVNIPAPLSGQPTEELARRARLLLVIDEVRAGRLTRAAAARALELTLDDFLIEAGRHGLYAITMSMISNASSTPTPSNSAKWSRA